jgi:hypothetical protein
MEGIKILKTPKLKKPYLIAAWPGMGEVAFKAASYLVEQLKAVECALIPPEEFFYQTGSTIHEGILELPQLPESKFYYWKNPSKDSKRHDLIIFLSNSQPDLTHAEVYSEKIIQYAKSLKTEMVISFASMPQAIEHTHEPAVWFSATNAAIKEEFTKFKFNILNDGQVSGMNGLFLGIAKKAGLKGLCLLGEIPLYTIQIENPKASHAVLEALAKIMNIPIDFTGLIEQARLMDTEINKLLEYLKIGSQAQPGPIGEDEIDLIKKTLSQLTKLPASVKEKIEKLFDQAKTDVAKANELKHELDNWNVYKEYEDRFLDLFRRPKEQGH